jgi:hypothetical protein
MVNKTRNKRKYTRNSKKIYGGDNNSLSQLGQQQLVNYAAKKGFNDNLSPDYQKLLKNPLANKIRKMTLFYIS